MLRDMRTLGPAELLFRDHGPLGRQDELRLLERELDEVRAGRPRIVLVDGPPGIGKTALLRRFLDGADGVRILEAGCAEPEAGLMYGVVGQLVRRAGVALPDV